VTSNGIRIISDVPGMGFIAPTASLRREYSTALVARSSPNLDPLTTDVGASFRLALGSRTGSLEHWHWHAAAAGPISPVFMVDPHYDNLPILIVPV